MLDGDRRRKLEFPSKPMRTHSSSYHVRGTVRSHREFSFPSFWLSAAAIFLRQPATMVKPYVGHKARR
jgi:hypothetical protein